MGDVSNTRPEGAKGSGQYLREDPGWGEGWIRDRLVSQSPQHIRVVMQQLKALALESILCNISTAGLHHPNSKRVLVLWY